MYRVLPKVSNGKTINCPLRTPILSLMPPSNVLNSLEQPGDVPSKMLLSRDPHKSNCGGDELSKQKALYRSMGGE
jgi:hypothetical protein